MTKQSNAEVEDVEAILAVSEAEKIRWNQDHHPHAMTPVDFDPNGSKGVLDTSEEARQRRLAKLALES